MINRRQRQRKLFCELSPMTYYIAVWKCCTVRRMRDALAFFSGLRFAHLKSEIPLPYPIYMHKSLIRRTLGNVDPVLQNNKAINLGLAAPKISGVLIRPGETFSFWRLVGSCTAQKGYKTGLTIAKGVPGSDIGGGMCQFTNLLHWMMLHTPLTIAEHHHHDGVDLFPDYSRQIPFGTGTSILYNYRDYRVMNPTQNTYQILVYTTAEYLCGELRAEQPQAEKYHIKAENEHFTREAGTVYRDNEIWREQIDKRTGQCVHRACLKHNHAAVMYDTSGLAVD